MTYIFSITLCDLKFLREKYFYSTILSFGKFFFKYKKDWNILIFKQFYWSKEKEL